MGKGVLEGADEIQPKVLISFSDWITPTSGLFSEYSGLVLDPIIHFVSIKEP
jgi:hypothetical protein